VIALLEADARRDFAKKRSIVDSVVSRVSRAAKADIEHVWMNEARANPSFPAFVDNHPEGFGVVGEVTVFGLPDLCSYLRQSFSWQIIFRTPPTSINLSWLGASPNDYSNNVERANVEIVFSRPLGYFFHEGRIQLIRKAAPNNELLIERLKAEFADAGFSCTVVDQ
jgi:hypothetical protein